MNKKVLHRWYARLRKLSYWPLAVGFVVFLLLGGLALRHNNQQMIRLRSAVFVADKDGTDVEKPLRALREYVYAHMNTNLSSGTNPVKPPIQLKYTYDRLTAAEKQRVSDATSQIYVDAQVDCEKRFPTGLSGSNRLPCIQQYVDSHGAVAKPIPEDLYKFDFQSPAWSPDLAGWSLVLSVIFLFVLAFRMGSDFLLRKQLKQHHH